MIKRQAVDQDQFYSILEGLRQASVAEIEDANVELTRPHLSSDEQDGGEAAFGLQQHQATASRYQQQHARLRAIEEAEERLATGCYGICMACGGDISIARLLATPTALRCVACQSQTEDSERALLA